MTQTSTTSDRIDDRIVELLRAQRRRGEDTVKWQPLRPGQCCLCGRSNDDPPRRKKRSKATSR